MSIFKDLPHGFSEVLILLCVSWIITHGVGFIVRYIEKKRKQSHLFVVVKALSLPVVVLLWTLASLFSLDILCENWLSTQHSFAFSAVTKSITDLSFGWFLFRYKNRFIAYFSEKKKKEDPESAEVIVAFSKIGSVAIILLELFLLNDVTGLSMTAVLAFGGVGGLALAFASQEIVQNFFGGFVLHLTRPFFHGESILIPQNNIEGSVERIGWYQTLIRSEDRLAMYIPNSVFTRACVVNKSRLKGRLFNPTLYVEMPRLELFEQFCLALKERLEEMDQISNTERLSVWITAIYGSLAQVSVFSVAKESTIDSFCQMNTFLNIEAQKLASSLGGTLRAPPQMSFMK